MECFQNSARSKPPAFASLRKRSKMVDERTIDFIVLNPRITIAWVTVVMRFGKP